MRRYIFILLFFFSEFTVAQSPFPGYRLAEQRLPPCFDQLLKCNCVQQIYQDKKGFMWFATTLGLIRFDGYDFKYFKHDPADNTSIANNYVYKIAEDKDGDIWAGLNQNGISCYNPVTDEFTNYNVSSNDSSSEMAVESIFIDDNNEVWFSFGFSGLCHLNKTTGSFDVYKIVTLQNCPHLTEVTAHYSNYAMDIKTRDKNSLWLATPEGLFIFDKTTKISEPVRAKAVDTSKPADYNARRIIQDGDILWIGGWSSGMQSYYTKTGKWEQYFFSEKGKGVYTDNIVTDMAEKNQDEIWVASSDRGLGIFNKKTRTTLFFHDDEHFKYLPKTYADLVFKDRQQNVWVRFENTFYKFSVAPEQVEAFKISSYKNQNSGISTTNIVFEDSLGRFVAVGTSFADGIVLTDRQLNKTFTIAVPRQHENVMQVLGFIQKDNRSLWVLTSDFLLILDLNTNQILKPRQPAGKKAEWGTALYSSFVMDENKNLWINTPVNGIIFYDTKTGISKMYSADSKDLTTTIAANATNCIAYDKKGRLWYGSRLAACYGYYNTKTKTNVVLDENGHPRDKIHSVKGYNFLNTDGNIYACTSSGLLAFDCSGDTPKLKSKINSANGIGADWVKSAAIDKSGNWWLITLFGLCRYNPAAKSLNIIDKSNGLYNEVEDISFTLQRNIYLTGTNYYYQVIESSKPSISNPIAPVITALKVNESEVNPAAMLNKNKVVKIPADYTYFSFAYASPDMVNADNTSYSYMLEGYDKKWIDAGDRRYANYTNLPGGDYVFKVRSSLGKQNKYSSITEIPVFVGTLFYKTFWFRALIACTLLLMVYTIYRYRLNKQLEINNLSNKAKLLEKEKSLVQYEILKQQLNPHFLFNSLAVLSSLVSLEPGRARTFIDKMVKIYRYILKSSDTELVHLSDEINFAANYLNLQQARYEKGLEVNIDINEDYDHRKIVPVTIQNMIENAIKHNVISAQSPLIINITAEDGYLVVKNNLQKKLKVETSNKVGLNQLKALYKYLSHKPIIIEETEKYFTIKIPLV